MYNINNFFKEFYLKQELAHLFADGVPGVKLPAPKRYTTSSRSAAGKGQNLGPLREVTESVTRLYQGLSHEQKMMLQVAYEVYKEKKELQDAAYLKDQDNWVKINERHCQNVSDYANTWFKETEAILCCYVLFPNDREQPYVIRKLGPEKVVKMMPDLKLTEIEKQFEMIKNETKQAKEEFILGRSNKSTNGAAPTFPKITLDDLYMMTAADTTHHIVTRLNALYRMNS